MDLTTHGRTTSESRFAAFVETLSSAVGHADRKAPLKAYCTGLILRSFAVIGRNLTFAMIMAAGSIAGSFLGGWLLGIVPSNMLLPVLSIILVVSAIKAWGHSNPNHSPPN